MISRSFFIPSFIHRYTCRPVNIICPKCDYKDEDDQAMCYKELAQCQDDIKQLEGANKLYVYWNTTVSDNCCLYCNNTVYKADTVIDTTQLEDKCESEETHVCRKIPGMLF